MRRLVLPLLTLLLLAFPAASADARKQTIKKAMWGPIAVDGRSQFPVYKDLGVGIFQYVIHWDRIAPTRPLDPANPADPAYQWPAEVDEAVAAGRAHGIKVSLMIIGAPSWANGGKRWFWAPDRPADFGDFAAAAARRYPAVRHWMIWGEPTKGANFQPLVGDDGKPLTTPEQLEGPRRYAQILDDSYAKLKAVSRRNKVIGGNTFTTGTVAPYHFLSAMRLPDGSRPRMDLFGHNPFTARRPRLNAPRLPNGYSDFSDLDDLAKRIDRAYKRAPRKFRRLKIFISEVSFPTDHANFEFNFYMSEKTQANFIKAALRITRRYARIYTFGYLGLYDDAKRDDNLQVERGLLRRDGSKKPGYRAFKRG